MAALRLRRGDLRARLPRPRLLIFPWIVIDRIGLWQAAHPSALRVVLWGALVVLPFIIAYNVFAYRVFAGKAKENLYD